MTSSQTSSRGERKPPPVQPGLLVALVGGGLLVVGWVIILHANRWHLTPPVIFLMLGWLAVLATAWFLGRAAMAATGVEDGDQSWSPSGQYEELLAEKKALLRALKDIEFDHQMGKMSDEDAGQLQRYYRARAIEVLKAIDTIEHGGGGTPLERIEREVRARLAVDAKGKKVAGGEGVKAEVDQQEEPAKKDEPS